jgi:hypothetical protein
MAHADFRANMSEAEFAAIRCDDDYPLDDYFAKLVDGNKEFAGIHKEFPRGYEDINLIRQLTPGQQLLIAGLRLHFYIFSPDSPHARCHRVR